MTVTRAAPASRETVMYAEGGRLRETLKQETSMAWLTGKKVAALSSNHQKSRWRRFNGTTNLRVR